ncbi:outer membrane protein assembly factor BamA [Altererythrobacter aquiaggeris]|uniref:outer membrane protein assembly factor BamA n=1 Tax=Aestuarierythrobacter aquiaggeris TaxID=1898396 RepID=UPI003015E55F
MATALLCGTVLAGLPHAAFAQDAASQPVTGQQQTAAAVQQDPRQEIIQTISVAGAQRLEPNTIVSYMRLRAGQPYTQADADEALKDLYATELFSDVTIGFNNGNVLVTVQENPVINRIVLEGNKRLKEDKIRPEIKLAPRQIFTRSKVRADVARILELYKRQGRFAASIEPQMVMLDQNRVDIVFEINEGPKSKVRQINIIGNEAFSDGTLRGEMITKQARLTSFFSSNKTYDPDRLAFDQQKLRQFYLTEGYADFRVVSAVAELTPDNEDFIITYVVEEGERYKFGDVAVESQLRDFDSEQLSSGLPMSAEDWYNAKLVEDTVEQLTEAAGAFGYAFADVRPRFTRNKEDLTMDVVFLMAEAPRVYVERIDVNGNTLTQDKVIRREFRIAEGDAFNSLQVKRSTNRINGLGYFQEGFEIEQQPGSAPDRIVLAANVEEKPTGQLQLSAGFSSLESFILAGSIQQRNFRGRGQTVGASVNYSRNSRSAQLSFAEPYLFDRNISAGIDVYRRDFNNNYFNRDNGATYEQSTTGFQLRAGVPISEFTSVIGSYTLNFDDVTLDENQFFLDLDGDGVPTCEPLLAGRYLCEAIGKRTSSILGLTLANSTLNSRFRPTAGQNVSIGVDYAGLGGSVKYVRLRSKATKYWQVLGDFIFSLQAEGGAIRGLEDRGGVGVDDVRLTDRFFLGEPQMRGFDVRGVGPRVIRRRLIGVDEAGAPLYAQKRSEGLTDDAIGGNAYYLGRAELEIPLGTGARELGLRPSIFLDVGSLFSITDPVTQSSPFPDGITYQLRDADGQLLFIGADGIPTTSPVDGSGNALDPVTQNIAPFTEEFVGDTWKPRIALGIGMNWNSPFGPLRIDFSRILSKQEGDDTKEFSFNVGTQF